MVICCVLASILNSGVTGGIRHIRLRVNINQLPIVYTRSKTGGLQPAMTPRSIAAAITLFAETSIHCVFEGEPTCSRQAPAMA